MNPFETYRSKIGEIGTVQQVFASVVFINGLPGAVPQEVVYFENGGVGQVMSINKHIEVMLFSAVEVRVGEKVSRSGKPFEITVGEGLLGRVVDPLMTPLDGGSRIAGELESRVVDNTPSGIGNRRVIDQPLTTGVTIVDLVVPLGKGQRELVIGDRKTEKTNFLVQAVSSQAKQGTICVYAVIGKKSAEKESIFERLQKEGVEKQLVVISSSAADPGGVVVITPFVAITVAEYFRDQGRDVLLIMDDMTTHARFYREIALLARRFPGRNSYPGDIFYVQARILERGGKFDKGSISIFPVAETLLGELSGYIQTNLMAITDGHIFFDKTLFNQGRRPAINPYLSVTRVGYQAQTTLIRDVSRELSRFLVHYKKMQEFLHFGAELNDDIQRSLQLGNQIERLFEQSAYNLMPVTLSIALVGALWSGLWKEATGAKIDGVLQQFIKRYTRDLAFKKSIDTLIVQSSVFSELVTKIKAQRELFAITI